MSILLETIQKKKLESKERQTEIKEHAKLENLVNLLKTSLEEDKAENIIVLDLLGKTTIADYMMIATGKVGRQLMAMTEHLDKILYQYGVKKTSMESSPDWVLLDAGDIIIHLFKEEAREYYNIERIWGIDIPETNQEIEIK